MRMIEEETKERLINNTSEDVLLPKQVAQQDEIEEEPSFTRQTMDTQYEAVSIPSRDSI